MNEILMRVHGQTAKRNGEMRCVVNGVKMTLMRDVARRGHGHMCEVAVKVHFKISRLGRYAAIKRYL